MYGKQPFAYYIQTNYSYWGNALSKTSCPQKWLPVAHHYAIFLCSRDFDDSLVGQLTSVFLEFLFYHVSNSFTMNY